MTCAVLGLLVVWAAIVAGCRDDEGCWMNGRCVSGRCECQSGWKGENCSLLDLRPAPVAGAYGYTPNVTSWGGYPFLENGTWHLHVAEMINGCGLGAWRTNSRVVHATSPTMLGPYKFSDVTLRDWAHNPVVVVDRSGPAPKYLHFHIGDGTPRQPVVCGSETPEPPVPQNRSVVMHVADSPYGPWEPVVDALPNVNNPSPFVFANGTVVLTGTSWKMWRAPSWRGPYTATEMKWSGDGGKGAWEDPFLWYDHTVQTWKLISHVWPSWAHDEPRCPYDYSLRVAGYAYSRDGVNWVKSPIPPFDNKVQHVDGTTSVLSTRERPKIIFADDGVTPIALANGVSSNPEPWGCKDKPGVDWTYTLLQPIGSH